MDLALSEKGFTLGEPVVTTRELFLDCRLYETRLPLTDEILSRGLARGTGPWRTKRCYKEYS